MAITLECINLIVPVATLDRVFAPQGGFAFFLKSFGAMREIVWYDDDLCRADGAMNWFDVDSMVAEWEGRGLAGLVETGDEKQWKDFCLATPSGGPTFPCPWLDFDAAGICVSMRGRPRGLLIGRESRSGPDAPPVEVVRCRGCRRDVTAEAHTTLGDAQFGGTNPVSIAAAEAWPESRIAGFLSCYTCRRCADA